MRFASLLCGILALALGLGLLASLLYDATEVVKLIGLEPTGNEAIVVLVGLALVAAAVSVGVRYLRRFSAREDGAPAG